MDFGSHTPYILAAYGATVVTIGALIAFRIYRFRAAMRADEEARKTTT